MGEAETHRLFTPNEWGLDVLQMSFPVLPFRMNGTGNDLIQWLGELWGLHGGDVIQDGDQKWELHFHFNVDPKIITKQL